MSVCAGVPRVHAARRHLAGVAAAGVHAGRAPVAAAGVRAQLLRRAARAGGAPAQRARAAAALQLHGVRAQHPAVAQRVPQAARPRRRRGGRGRGRARRRARRRRRAPLLGRPLLAVILTNVLAIGKITCIIGVFGE